MKIPQISSLALVRRRKDTGKAVKFQTGLLDRMIDFLDTAYWGRGKLSLGGCGALGNHGSSRMRAPGQRLASFSLRCLQLGKTEATPKGLKKEFQSWGDDSVGEPESGSQFPHV